MCSCWRYKRQIDEAEVEKLHTPVDYGNGHGDQYDVGSFGEIYGERKVFFCKGVFWMSKMCCREDRKGQELATVDTS